MVPLLRGSPFGMPLCNGKDLKCSGDAVKMVLDIAEQLAADDALL